MVLTAGLAVFYLMNDKELEYKLISYLVIGLGMATSLFFLYFIREKDLVAICQEKKLKFKEKISQ